jgi:hypothetical protein
MLGDRLGVTLLADAKKEAPPGRPDEQLPFGMKPTPPNIFISLTPSTPARQARTRAARSSSPFMGTALSRNEG